MHYNDLPDNIKENMAMGHVLAEHNAYQVDTQTYDLHVTTVQVIAEDPTTGAPLYFCNDTCVAECTPGSVQLLMVEMPQQEQGLWSPPPAAEDRLPFEDVPISQVMEHHPNVAYTEIVGREPTVWEMARAEAAAALDDDVNAEAARRLEVLRQWVYARFRRAVQNDRPTLVQVHAATLFIIETGKDLGDEAEAQFIEHAMNSVKEGAETLPVFLPEQDCGE